MNMPPVEGCRVTAARVNCWGAVVVVVVVGSDKAGGGGGGRGVEENVESSSCANYIAGVKS